MRIKYILILLSLILFLSCSKEPPEVTLSDPGFGVVETQINAGPKVVDLPVLFNTELEVKGIQFTLTWDATIAKVGQPQLTDQNPGFTVSTSKGGQGAMKVLIFSMTGDVLNTLDPEIMTIPVSILDPQAEAVSLIFDQAVFAGPNAMSYDIPITHASLTIQHS